MRLAFRRYGIPCLMAGVLIGGCLSPALSSNTHHQEKQQGAPAFLTVTSRPIPSDAGTPRPHGNALGQAVTAFERVTVNFEAIRIHTQARPNATILGAPGQAFPVRLRSQSSIDYVTIDRVEQHNGARTLVGHVNGYPLSSFVLAIDGYSVHGIVEWDHHRFLIAAEPKSGIHTATTIDKRLIPWDIMARVYEADTPAVEAKGVEKALGLARTARKEWAPKASNLPPNGNVRTLFMYSDTVASTNNAPALISSIVSDFNETLDSSAVAEHFYMTVAASVQVDDNYFGECNDSALADMEAERAPFDNLNGNGASLDNLMANVEADIGVFIVTAEPPDSDGDGGIEFNCTLGVGRVGGVASGFGIHPFDSDSGPGSNPHTVITDDYALGDRTATHEIGHVLGGEHPGDVPPESVPEFAQGWINDVADPPFQSIMGDYQGLAGDGDDPNPCDFNGLPPDCARRPYWTDGGGYCGHVINGYGACAGGQRRYQ